MDSESLVDLGFAQVRTHPGVHVCQIYDDGIERLEAVVRFVARGLRDGEATACVSEHVGWTDIEAWCARDGISLRKEEAAGHFTLSESRELYFHGGRFEPDRMLAKLARYYDDSVRASRTGARIIGEMNPEIARIPGGSGLLSYESRVNDLLRERPLVAVCQYDAQAFDGSTIMDLLTVHPMMVMHGTVVENPFFIPPEELVPP